MTALKRHAFVLIFFFALLLRLGYLIDIHETFISRLHTWKQSDMNTYLTVAGQIVEGDLLVPMPYHPYHGTHAAVGSREQWERWLGGEHVFYQMPGYYYFLAAMLKLFGGSVLAVKVVHAILGAGHAVLLGLVGEKMIERRAGIIVGLLAAIYGPFIAAEAMILREGPAMVLAAAGLYQVLRALEPTEAAAKRWQAAWVGAGLALGLAGLMRESGLFLFAAIWLWASTHSLLGREPLPRTVPWLLLGGFLVPFVPLVIRNLAVGASPFSLTPQFSWNFATANAVDNISGGARYEVPLSLSSIMASSDGRLIDAIRLTLLTYQGMPGQFVLNWWTRFSTIWSNVEIPDNYSYDYLVAHSRLLSTLPRFVCIWIPAIGTFVLVLWHRLARLAPGTMDLRLGISFAPRTLSLIFLCLATNVILLSLSTVVGRYRLTIVPFLMLLAGAMLTQAILWFRMRETLKLGALSASLVTLSLLWWLWPVNPIVQSSAIRATDFIVAAKDLALNGDLDGARREIEEGYAYCSIQHFGFEWLGRECVQALIPVTQLLSATRSTDSLENRSGLEARP